MPEISTPFGWSVSRHRRLEGGRLSYPTVRHASRVHWSSHRSPRRSHLRRLTALQAALAMSVHSSTCKLADALIGRTPTPSLPLMIRRFPGELNLMALEWVQGEQEWPSMTPRGLAAWNKLKGLPSYAILWMDRVCTFSIDGSSTSIDADLLYHSHHGPVLIDWRSGPHGKGGQQPATYACFLEDGLGYCLGGRGLLCTLCHLASGDERTLTFRSADLDSGRAMIGASASLMRRLIS
jgi:hypothetical protein